MYDADGIVDMGVVEAMFTALGGRDNVLRTRMTAMQNFSKEEIKFEGLLLGGEFKFSLVFDFTRECQED